MDKPYQTCETCIYFRPEGKTIRGRCRRYPTTVEKNKSDWCGEHKQEIQHQR